MQSCTYKDYNDVINELQDYMITNDLVKRSLLYKKVDFLSPPSSSLSNNVIKDKPIIMDKKKQTVFYPKQKDSLFWCFYILKNGFSNYEMEINNQYFVVEKTEKFKYLARLRKPDVWWFRDMEVNTLET